MFHVLGEMEVDFGQLGTDFGLCKADFEQMDVEIPTAEFELKVEPG